MLFFVFDMTSVLLTVIKKSEQLTEQIDAMFP